ncbi:pilus assembly protein [Collimonas sp.]|jgi:type IV pilus assembly protein PilY1|uniref:pilus assembly protein n=1 Tax=Collimonas sp. TaxID=1963772 RepID=UPI002C331C50|nr:PilC/PilY family type IV pilus protein [Collimonas sp.]HWX00165.1 PilC/PilY family type IV pilus protein [Collimonas sp.]
MLRTSVSRRMPLGRLVKLAAHCVCLAMAAVSGVALAEIAQVPLFLPVPPPPNIMYMLDNSGSMVWGTVTGLDATAEYDSAKDRRSYYSSAWNQIYYSPATTYSPGVNSDGTSMGAASTGATIIDPYLDPSTTLDNISEGCYATSAIPLPLYDPAAFSPYNNCRSSSSSKNNTYVAQYAFYYNWAGSGTPTGSSGQNTSTNYTRVDILPSTKTYPKATTRTDCAAASTCTYAEEIQNFANWFSYYRTRILMTKTSLGTAFAGISDRFRVGFATINDNNSNTNTDATNFVPLSTFSATQKAAWYAKLYAISPGGGTPLIAALDNVGQYYMGNGMYGASTVDDPVQLKCQANYTILSTDGFWNGSVPSTIGDQDGKVPATLPAPINNDPVSGTALTPGSAFPTPFYEGKTANSNTLADTAMKYWINDVGVRSGNGGTVGKITATPTDPATWQHMTTHTIGLGANGTLIYQPDYKTATTGDYAAIKAGTKNWPTPVADDPTAIDDLWHTAVNGHGSYFSAKNPQLLQAGLNSILAEIGRATGSGSSIAYPGTAVSSSAYAYVPSFDSGTWAGHLKAFAVNTDGTLNTTPQWDAATLLPAYASRNIVTWNPTSKAAVNFAWGSLTTGTGSQQSALVSTNVVDYLRGNSAMEQAADGSGSGIYRYRQYKLGDIVNSSPLFVQSTDFGYSVLPAASGGGATYTTFLSTKSTKNANGVVYVGANDGMLHAFDANSGVETFAFIPNSVYPNLKTLSDPNYGHHYFVDGPLAEGDAYIGSAWKNILLGTTGAGAQSVFAVDITPTGTTFNGSALSTGSVLWEYAAGSDADLGNVLGAPAVVQLATGKWAALFGNGYNSSNGHAVLYLVDVNSGALLNKIDTGVGSATSLNGLSAPTLLFNSQRQVVAAYAGDLQGNLWKFDLSNSDSTKWTSSALFTATNASSVVQPIVQAPAIASHPLGGYMVMIGTGKYIETTDKANTDTQSVYGIWDKAGAATATRSQLVQQTLTNVLSSTGALLGRTVSSNAINWVSQRGWYIDLPASGERAVGNLQVLKNIILLTTTLSPNTADPCSGGGSSQIMGVNYLSGAYSSKFSLIVAGTTATNLASATIAGTVGTPLPMTPPDPTKPPCLEYVDLTGKTSCQPFNLKGVAVRRWRQLSLHP